MRKTFSALIALAALSAPAFAADMPLRKAPVAPEYAADWTGFTIGLLGGGGWATAKPDFGPFGGKIDFDGKLKGWVAGAYAGYNWQVANFVLGVEGDYTQADINNTQTIGGIDVHTKVDRLASVRARVGFLVTPHLLAYGTGGVGFGSAEASATIPTETPVNLVARGNHWGWVAGGGAEYSLGAKIKVRAEYLHYDFASANYAVGVPFNFNVNSTLTVDVVRAGLGIQF